MQKPEPESFTHQEGRAQAHGWSRRQAMQTMLGTAGAGLVLPGLAAAQPRTGEAAERAGAAAEAGQTAAAGEWQPAFLDAHQNETLSAIGERLVPDSAAAEANRFIDTLLSVESEDTQRAFVAALNAFEHEAIAQHGQPFKDLSADEQNAILKAASELEPSQPAPMGRRRRPLAPPPPTGGAEAPAASLRDHFETLKQWVGRSYYSSEAGMRELGWTGQVAWDSMPGCDHPDHPS